jgi:hypothetical protein
MLELYDFDGPPAVELPADEALVDHPGALEWDLPEPP